MSEALMETIRQFACGDSEEVTYAEIIHTERLLGLVTLNNHLLSNISKWILIWEDIRNISGRLYKFTDKQFSAVADAYKNLLIDAARVGEKALKLASQCSISSEHFKIATDCDIASVQACIAFLQDQFTQWFDDSIPEDKILRIWKGQPSEPVSMV